MGFIFVSLLNRVEIGIEVKPKTKKQKKGYVIWVKRTSVGGGGPKG